MRKIVAAIDTISEKVSRWSSYLILVLILLTVQQVFARYLFNDSSMAAQEWEWHLFSIIFLLGAANTLRTNGHVRVDIHYARLSQKQQALIEIFGTLCFLLPMAALTTYYGFKFAQQSYIYVNPHPHDYLTTAWFGKDSILYGLFASIEGWLRGFLLVGEISPNPGGLEARWLIKALIPLAFILLGLQAVAELLRSLQKFRGGNS